MCRQSKRTGGSKYSLRPVLHGFVYCWGQNKTPNPWVFLSKDFLSQTKFPLSKEIFIPIGTFSACGNIPYSQKNSPHRQKGPFWGREISIKGENFFWERKFLFREKISVKRISRICRLVVTSTITNSDLGLYGVPWYPPVRDVQQSNLQQSPSRDRGSHLRSASTHQKRYSIRIESRWNIKFKFDEEFEKWFHSEPFPSNLESIVFTLVLRKQKWKLKTLTSGLLLSFQGGKGSCHRSPYL